MPAGSQSTPTADKPSVEQPQPGTSGRTPQQKRTQDSSPSPERKRPHRRGEKRSPTEGSYSPKKKLHLRGSKREHETETDGSVDTRHTKREAKFSNDENIPVRRSRQQEFKDLVTSSDTEDDPDSIESQGTDTTSDEDINRVQTSEIEVQTLMASTTPTKGTDGSAGWDLKSHQSVSIQPGH